MRHVDHHQGLVPVVGLVSVISPEEQTLGLIDPGEFQECGVTTCAQLILPGRWTGPMPAARNIVRVEGEVQQSGGKLILVARTLETVEPQPGRMK